MFPGEFNFIVETIEELKYRKAVIRCMCADWLKDAIVRDKGYDSYIEDLETAFTYLDFAVATLQGIVDVVERKKE